MKHLLSHVLYLQITVNALRGFLNCHQTLWHTGNWHHIFPPLLYVSLLQAVSQICKFTWCLPFSFSSFPNKMCGMCGCDLCFGRWRVLAVFSWPGKWRKPQRSVKTSSRQPAAYWTMCSSLSSETTRRCRYFYSPSDVSRDIFTVYAGHCMFKESLRAEKVIITACNPL